MTAYPKLVIVLEPLGFLGLSSFRSHAEFVACRVTEVEAPATGKLKDWRGDLAACGLEPGQGVFQVVGLSGLSHFLVLCG